MLHTCLPDEATSQGGRGHGFRQNNSLSGIFDSHPSLREHLAPCLLQLYVHIEFTGRDSQFYEKFQMRSVIGEVLAYLWTLPAHKQAWKAVAAQVSMFGSWGL